MRELIIRSVGGAIGALGFVIFFEVKTNRIIASLLGSIIGTTVYLLFEQFGMHAFVSNTIAAFVITIYSEVAARILRSPAVVFQMPGVIVLVPGKSLYYTMSDLISGNFAGAGQNAIATLQVGAGIVDGIICGTLLFGIIKLIIDSARGWMKKRRKAK